MLDAALASLIAADGDEQAGERLESLIESRLAPLVRTIVARKLRAYGAANMVGAEDLEDVAGDALLVLVQRLQALRSEAGAVDIENLDGYTAAVAYSACARYLRRRYPDRARLKSRLRYILQRDRRFALWDVPAAGPCCGLAARAGDPPERSAAEAMARLEREPERWPRSWAAPALVDHADPAPLVADIFRLAAGPIELDALVRMVAAIWRLERSGHAERGDQVEHLHSASATPEVSLDRRRFVERLWTEIGTLPVRQRIALLLNLRDGQGAGLLWILPVTGVASVRTIAATLEMPAEELAALWSQLPIDDNAIAARLGCTRQQVINLRMSARKRLGNRLRMLQSPTGRFDSRRANLPDPSASTEKDT